MDDYISQANDHRVWFTLRGTSDTLEITQDKVRGPWTVVRRGWFGEDAERSPYSTRGLGMVVGKASALFDFRKHAENYALVSAMYVNGDIDDEELLDPRRFGGRRLAPNYDHLDKLYRSGVHAIDPLQGWDQVDPTGALKDVRTNLWLADEEPSEEEKDRLDEVDQAAMGVVGFYMNHLLEAPETRDPEDIVSECVYGSFADGNARDRALVFWVSMARLRGHIPALWCFRRQFEEAKKTFEFMLPELSEADRNLIGLG